MTYIAENCIDIIVTAFVWRHQKWTTTISRYYIFASVFENVFGPESCRTFVPFYCGRNKPQYLEQNNEVNRNIN